MPRGLHGRAGPGRGPMMAEKVWRLTPCRCHTAKYVLFVCLGSSCSAKAAGGQGVRTLRVHNAIAGSARPAHATSAPTLGSGCAAVVLGQRLGLSLSLRPVPCPAGSAGAPRRVSDPAQYRQRGALYRMRAPDDDRAGRHASRLPLRCTSVWPERPREPRNRTHRIRPCPASRPRRSQAHVNGSHHSRGKPCPLTRPLPTTTRAPVFTVTCGGKR